MAKIKTVKSAILRLLDNKRVYFDDGLRSGEVEKLSICSGGECYTVTLSNGADRGRMRMENSGYLFTNKNDLYR